MRVLGRSEVVFLFDVRCSIFVWEHWLRWSLPTAGVAPQVFNRYRQVFGPGRLNHYGLAGDRMRNVQLFGMKSGPPQQRAFLLVRLEAVTGLEPRQAQWLPTVQRVAD